MARFLLCSLLLIFLIGLAYVSTGTIPEELSPISDTAAHDMQSEVEEKAGVPEPVPLAVEGSSSVRTHPGNDNH
jgi:hypothetical protein